MRLFFREEDPSGGRWTEVPFIEGRFLLRRGDVVRVDLSLLMAELMVITQPERWYMIGWKS